MQALDYEPRLRGLPEGLLDQPFYGWDAMYSSVNEPASAGERFGQ